MTPARVTVRWAPCSSHRRGDFKFDTDGDGESGTDTDLKNVIKKGGLAYDGSPLMAAWPALSDGDLDNLVAFIRSLKQ